MHSSNLQVVPLLLSPRLVPRCLQDMDEHVERRGVHTVSYLSAYEEG